MARCSPRARPPDYDDPLLTPALAVALLRSSSLAGAPAPAPWAAASAGALVRLAGGRGFKAERVKALAAQGVGYDARCHELVACGALPALLALLQRYAAEPSVCGQACLALRAIAGAEAEREPAARGGVAEAMVAVLGAHAREAAVCDLACSALVNVAAARSAVGREACFSSGAVPALLAAITAHTAEAGVVESACWALRNMAFGEQEQDAITGGGAVPVIAAALAAHAGSARAAGAAEQAAVALAVLANTEAGRAAGAAAALPPLVAALLTHAAAAGGGGAGEGEGGEAPRAAKAAEASARACEWACRALYKITAGPYEDAACAAGAPAAIAAALRAHAAQSPGLCEQAASALANIAAAPSARAACLGAGALGALAHALRAQGKDSACAERTCRAVYKLCSGAQQGGGEDGLRAALSEGGAGDLPALLASALDTHGGDAGVCEQACSAVAALAAEDEGGRVVAAGCIPLLVRALGAHAGDARTSERAARALQRIAGGPHEDACARAGAVGALAATLKAYTEGKEWEGEVVRCAAGALGNIAHSGEGAAACQWAGVARLMVEALRAHAEEGRREVEAAEAAGAGAGEGGGGLPRQRQGRSTLSPPCAPALPWQGR